MIHSAAIKLTPLIASAAAGLVSLVAGADFLAATEIGGAVAIWLRIEHRMTRLETIVSMTRKIPADLTPGGSAGE